MSSDENGKSTNLKKISVVVLFVADIERSIAFYRDTLGIPLKFRDDASAAFDFDATMLIVLTIAGAQDLLTEDAVAVSRPAGATSQLVSFVDDVDSLYGELLAKGVEFVRQPVDRDWGLRTAHFKDPDGNIWEIAQPIGAAPS
jgi:catechol 2,3-dioxygenase-like lactoylglutathione lyase family enzyme